ncbi:MAG: DUF4038 domain-containing protein [Microcella sp.]|uniref:apiosidase-like domain-containing protein n=1 Tax=Microcella sp. TaxID=1913979 RepID=UPI0024C63A20|nr:DUF4038 domain-containing protein [Microcella sp.]UYN83167.1 MAG: DUF4038 domain-containing protein [Microcella sp.]
MVSTFAQHDVVELTLTGPEQPLPVGAEAPVTALVTHDDGESISVPGFWDGGRRYLVRIAASRPGRWSWSTRSAAAELSGATGEFTVVESEHPGPVRVANMFHFAHADGSTHWHLGTTVYNWMHQSDELMAETLDSIAEAGFTKLRFLVFPQTGAHVPRIPELLPFEHDADGGFDVRRPVPEFFHRLDAAVEALGARGMQADVLIFNAYDNGRVGLDALSEDDDAIYLRYLVARLAAHPHVWWSLCNEFDLMQRPWSRWDAMGELLREVDPYDRLRSIHNWIELFDHNRPWVTHASIQNALAPADFGRAVLYRDAYRKPIVLDEFKYEGDTVERWGNLTGAELVHRFWITTVSGCHGTHGESFVKPDDGLHMVEGGTLQGESPTRLRFLLDTLRSLWVTGLDPIDKWDDPAFVAGVARQQYVQYLGRSAPAEWVFRLPQGNTGDRLQPGDAFEVTIIDTWNMTRTPVEGRFVLDDVRRNDAFATASEPVPLPAGEALALLITRVD